VTPLKTKDGLHDISFINTEEELEATLIASSREINTCIVHHTGTFLDQILTAQEIHDAYIKKNVSEGIPYHFIILKDGTLQRGRRIDDESFHAGTSYKTYSIGIAFVGGINLHSVEADRRGGRAGFIADIKSNTGDSFTSAQWATFAQFIKVWYQVVPYGQVLGHKDINQSGTLDPGFNVANYIQSRFGRANTIDGSTGTLNLSGLLTKAGG